MLSQSFFHSSGKLPTSILRKTALHRQSEAVRLGTLQQTRPFHCMDMYCCFLCGLVVCHFYENCFHDSIAKSNKSSLIDKLWLWSNEATVLFCSGIIAKYFARHVSTGQDFSVSYDRPNSFVRTFFYWVGHAMGSISGLSALNQARALIRLTHHPKAARCISSPILFEVTTFSRGRHWHSGWRTFYKSAARSVWRILLVYSFQSDPRWLMATSCLLIASKDRDTTFFWTHKTKLIGSPRDSASVKNDSKQKKKLWPCPWLLSEVSQPWSHSLAQPNAERSLLVCGHVRNGQQKPRVVSATYFTGNRQGV